MSHKGFVLTGSAALQDDSCSGQQDEMWNYSVPVTHLQNTTQFAASH